MATVLIGPNCKFYWKSANTFASPTWSEITAMKDVARNDAWDVIEAPDRSTTVKAEAKSQRDISVTASMKKKAGDAGVNAVLVALESQTGNIDIMVLDGAKETNGARGVRFEAVVTQGNEDQALTNALYLDLRFAPDAFSDNRFQSVLVTAGSPAFTNL